MTSSINPQIFREYDIRGIVGKDLTPESVTSIGKAIGTYIRRRGGKTMILGRDVRSSSIAFRDILAQSLNSTGCDMNDCWGGRREEILEAVGIGIAVSSPHGNLPDPPPKINHL